MNKTIEAAALRHAVKSIESLRDENEALRAKLAKATEIMERARMNENQDGCTREVIGWCKCWRHAIDEFVSEQKGNKS